MMRIIGAILLMCTMWASALEAHIVSALTKGHTYAVVWSYAADGSAVREFLTLLKSRRDGWALMRNPLSGGPQKWVNLEQALTVTRMEELVPSTPPPPVALPSLPPEVFHAYVRPTAR